MVTTHKRPARAPAWVLRPTARAVLGAFLTSGAAGVHPGPLGPAVTSGSGRVNQAGAVTTIEQSSPRLSINWQGFSIGAGESVAFRQPSAQAIALNRVLGQDPSVILGNLTANGQVFLLNPNGVLFGASAHVDVGGIVASTLNLSDADFVAGRYTFSGNSGSGSVVNRGTIRAADGGYVALVGPRVSNEGLISARLGTVALGAGEQVTLRIDGQQLVAFSVDKAAVDALAANKQLIQADGGTVILSAQAKDALISTVVNNEGIVEARSVSVKNGVIRLEGGASGVVSARGKLDASGANPGERGGQVRITGEKVALMDGALVDASGRSGGGKVLVGGDFQGKNPAVQNATRTYVAPTANIRADATDAGDGGTVVVWADGDTRFRGSISARGGSGGGDGGRVEVSGKQQLGFDGRVDTSAARGGIGELLLDPDDLYVSTGPVSGAEQEFANPFRAIDGVTNRYVLASTLTAVSANTAVILQANDDIIFQANLAMPTTAAGSITMTAVNSIQMGGSNLSTANGSVSMTAGAGGITGSRHDQSRHRCVDAQFIWSDHAKRRGRDRGNDAAGQAGDRYAHALATEYLHRRDDDLGRHSLRNERKRARHDRERDKCRLRGNPQHQRRGCRRRGGHAQRRGRWRKRRPDRSRHRFALRRSHSSGLEHHRCGSSGRYAYALWCDWGNQLRHRQAGHRHARVCLVPAPTPAPPRSMPARCAWVQPIGSPTPAPSRWSAVRPST